MDAALRANLNKRALLLQNANSLFETVCAADAAPSQGQYKAYLDRVNRLIARFDEVEETLIEANASLSKGKQIPINDEREQFDRLTNDVVAKCYDSNTPVVPATRAAPTPSVHLKSVEVPHFAGSNFSQFWEVFESLVDKNASLTPTIKYHYLLGALSENVKSLIAGFLPINDANYDLAKAALVDHYDNPRRIASTHVQSLLNAPVLSNNYKPNELSDLVRVFRNNFASLKKMEIPDLCSFLLFQICYSKLDKKTRMGFETQSHHTKVPCTLDELLDYLQSRVQIADLDSIVAVDGKPKPSTPSNSKAPRSLLAEEKKYVCPIDKENHPFVQCPKFLSMTIDQRSQIIKDNNLCFLCFGKHRRPSCKSTKTCKHCKSSSHHGLLCRQSNTSNVSSESEPTLPPAAPKSPTTRAGPSSGASSPTSLGCHYGLYHYKQTLLATAIVSVDDASGQPVLLRGVVDPGSQVEVLSEKAAQLLGLQRSQASMHVQGLGGRSSKVKGVVKTTIRSRHNPSFRIETECLVLPQLCGKLPTASLDPQVPDLPYADPKWHIPADIDVLLGAGVYSQIVSDAKPVIKLYDNLVAIPSELGYLLLGQARNSSSSLLAASLLSIDDSLNTALERFWKIEEGDSAVPCSIQEAQAEDVYTSTTYRETDGRYVVRLPFKDDAVPLVENQRSPMLHYQKVEQRLNKNPENLQLYDGYFSDLVTSGLMSKATKPSKYLLLHHAVFKESSTTRVRPVFDASSPDRHGNSLNSQLLAGPALQSDLSHVLMRFRMHPIPLLADMRRMYLTVMLHPDDRQHQHVLWRPTPESEIQEYELNSVTFGVASSAYLAQRTVQQLIQDEGCEFPLASHVLKKCIYVDDVVSSFPDVPTAVSARDQLIELTSRGKFELRKFCSTKQEVLHGVPSEHQEAISFSDGNPSLSVLGTYWSPKSDTFSFSIPKEVLESQVCTKRSVLSAAARIFDCQGLLAPVTLAIKVLLRTLWQSKIDWDTPVPPDIHDQWLSFTKELPLLSNLQLPRSIPAYTCDKLEIVGFSDASSYGMGAAIYLRCVTGATASLHLIKGKSKASPVKPTLTIPRAELQACKILVDMYRGLLPLLNELPITATHFFTDSSIVLCWLNTPTQKLQLFVANRVSQIISYTHASNWHHVNSSANCADPASRSLTPKHLLESELWWHGPSFLQCEPIQWPPPPPLPAGVPEPKKERAQTLLVSSAKDFELFISRFSSLKRLVRVTCWVRRFIEKCRRRPVEQGSLTSHEITCATHNIVRQIQAEHWPVSQGILCPKPLQSLSPFLDQNGLLRVGGRLKNSPLAESAKHPILIPEDSHYASLVCRDAHANTLYGGTQLMRAHIQNTYWIISVTKHAKRAKRQCTRCARFSNKPIEPQMADLPKSRFCERRAFVNTSCDFCGPFSVHESPRARAKILKAYVCVFTCMASRAIHLELVQDLSTDAFLAAVDRFTARRGLASLIYCDNGTNLTGANRVLKEVRSFLKEHGSETEAQLAQKQIVFQFSPPLSPAKNGLTERIVGLFKFHLTRVVGNSILTYTEFHTLIVRIEAVLNSRPLIPLSVDPTDGILTPGHLLVGDSLLAVPEQGLDSLPNNSLSRWQHVKGMLQSFWRKWRDSYLQTLMERAKWRSPATNLEVGTIVLMKGENTPPLAWPLAIIDEVHPHKDGTTRVVTVRTAHGSYVRCVNKLIPLHVE